MLNKEETSLYCSRDLISKRKAQEMTKDYDPKTVTDNQHVDSRV